MTRLHRELITCNYCGNEEPMTLFDLIDLEEDPDLKERILQKISSYFTAPIVVAHNLWPTL